MNESCIICTNKLKQVKEKTLFLSEGKIITIDNLPNPNEDPKEFIEYHTLKKEWIQKYHWLISL